MKSYKIVYFVFVAGSHQILKKKFNFTEGYQVIFVKCSTFGHINSLSMFPRRQVFLHTVFSYMFYSFRERVLKNHHLLDAKQSQIQERFSIECRKTKPKVTTTACTKYL